jgi:hypothetical protein
LGGESESRWVWIERSMVVVERGEEGVEGEETEKEGRDNGAEDGTRRPKCKELKNILENIVFKINRFCSATAHAAYLVLTSHSGIFHVQERIWSLCGIDIPGQVNRSPAKIGQYKGSF